jgi:hypothetical protein
MSIFHCFFKNAKFGFLQVTKVTQSQERGEIWSSHLSHRYLTKMHCSHLIVTITRSFLGERLDETQTIVLGGSLKILKTRTFFEDMDLSKETD